MTKRLFTDREAANYLGVSRSTIWLLMNEGKLGSLKIGKFRRIELTELDRFIAENSQSA